MIKNMNDQNLPTTRIFLYSDPTANKITLWDIIALVMVCGLKTNPSFSRMVISDYSILCIINN